jgi:molybdopterin synthase sulfur carrier subunit
MRVKILIFGPLTDIIKKNELYLPGVADTDAVVKELNRVYPALGSAKFRMAVNKKTITGNTGLEDGSTVALLPPFSGG